MERVNIFERSEEFDAWLTGLKDKAGRARIIHRIRSAGTAISATASRWAKESPKCASASGRAIEPISRGAQRWSILLLVGGDKSSQKRDIKRAIEMARALDKE